MKVSELLAQAFGLVKVMPTKGQYAIDAQGYPTDPTFDNVCGVCSLGALRRVAGVRNGYAIISNEEYTKARLLLNAETESLRIRVAERGAILSIHEANDHCSTEVLHSIWEATIAKARAEEGCAL